MSKHADRKTQAAPNRDLELQVKKHPEDKDAKVDLGSDGSMDASDPSAAAQPGNTNDPVPSSGFPEKEGEVIDP